MCTMLIVGAQYMLYIWIKSEWVKFLPSQILPKFQWIKETASHYRSNSDSKSTWPLLVGPLAGSLKSWKDKLNSRSTHVWREGGSACSHW